MSFGVKKPVIPADPTSTTISADRARDLFVAVHDVNGDGFDDVYLAGYNTSPDRGDELQTGLILINDREDGFTPAGGDRPTGFGSSEILVADFNGDGVPDLFNADFGHDFFPFNGGPNQLYLGDGHDGFVDASDRLPGLSDLTHSAAAGDIDGDGDQDIYVGNIGGVFNPYFLINDGQANFTLDRERLPDSVATSVNAFSQVALSSHIADVNGDGAVDLLLGADRSFPEENDFNRIFLNDGSGNFSDNMQIILPKNTVAGGAFKLNLDLNVVDINEDGLQDLVVLQTDDYSGWAIQLLIATPEGGFVDETATRITGPAFGRDDNNYSRFIRLEDVNQDGREDIVLTDIHNVDRPAFLLNNTFGGYSSVPGSDYGAQNPMFEFGVNSPVLGGKNILFADAFTFEGEKLFVTTMQTGLPDFEGRFTSRSEMISGDKGGDLIFAAAGNDTVRGLGGGDSIDGGGGKDMLTGNAGKDMLRGGGGRDTLEGGGGKDMLEGGRGKDEVNGAGGRDMLKGDGGRDFLDGGGGGDLLDGGRGRDDLTGGRGADTFLFATGSGKDTITDFQQGTDSIEIERGADSFGDLLIRQAGQDVEIAFANVKIIVTDASADDFTAADFIF